jgi:peptide/nickel transport system permease protein
VNRSVVVAAGLLLAVIVFVFFVEVLLPIDPLGQDSSRRLLPPGTEHLFGTDGFGRDQLARVLDGAKNSIITALIALAIAAPIGIAAGAISAYLPGIVDALVQRAVDLVLGIPFLLLCIVFVIALEPSVTSVGLALAVALAPQIARVSRAAILPITQEPFVIAARLSGARTKSILLRHLLPNAIDPIIAHVTGLFGTSIAAEASLSFLGLGIPAPYPSLGRMLKEGAGLMLEAAPWLVIFPGLAIALLVFTAAFVGDTLTSKRPWSAAGDPGV